MDVRLPARLAHRRRWYRQWEEELIPPTVVFEVLSPGNTHGEMIAKQDFYEEHGVEEYYVYDRDNNRLQVYLRKGQVLQRVRPVEGFVSPRLGIRFDLSGPELVVSGPEGRFLTFEELKADRDQARNGPSRPSGGQATAEELQELDRLEEQSSPAPPEGR